MGQLFSELYRRDVGITPCAESKLFHLFLNSVNHPAVCKSDLMDVVAVEIHVAAAARILDPQFQGQVKERLTSRDALKLIAQVVKDPFEVWLNSHVEFGKRIAELAINQALTRMKSAQKTLSPRFRAAGVTLMSSLPPLT